MRVSEQFPSKYLKAADLDGDTSLTILNIEIEEMKSNGSAEDKMVVYFQEIDKGLMLNKTNAVTIAKVLNDDDTDGWIGKRITLFPTQVDFQGKQVESIRVKVRPPRPNGAARSQATAAGGRPPQQNRRPAPPPPPPDYDDAPPPMDDDIPF